MNCVFKREIYFFKEYQASKKVMWVKALGIFKEHKLFSLLRFRQTPTFFVLKLVKMFDTNSNYFKSCKNWTFKNSGKGMAMGREGAIQVICTKRDDVCRKDPRLLVDQYLYLLYKRSIHGLLI